VSMSSAYPYVYIQKYGKNCTGVPQTAIGGHKAPIPDA
jgi:hypothetical protein